MKPVTSALHNWMSSLFVHPLLRGASFWHLPDGVGSIHYNTYTIGMTPVPDHIDHSRQNLLLIECSNTKSNHIYVSVHIKQPDVIFQPGEENQKCYTHLKLKDIIEFVKMYKKNFESQYGKSGGCYGLYYAEPFKDGLLKTIKEFILRNPKAYGEYKNMVKTCFDFLDKCEATNLKKNEIKKDFHK